LPIDPESIRSILLAISVALSILFFPYGLNFYYLMRRAQEYEIPNPNGRKKYPVTIQLPIYNERYVVERLVDACIRMIDHYGKEAVQLMLLDDSTDETTEIAEKTIERFRNLGYDMTFIHRDNREGFKAGALKNAMPETKHSFIAIFDADFMPPEDFLDRVIPYFEDPNLAIVQCRWTHFNRDYNFITRAIAIGYDGHHMVEQTGRTAGGFLLNFNGSAGVIRKEALEEAGGWQADTLAEDLDASYRIQLKGWKAIYLRSIECPAEIPPTIPAVKRQQTRWASGSMRVFRKLCLRILGHKRLSIGQKVEGLIHLSYYAVHPFMFSAFVIALVAALLDVRLVNVGVLQFPEPPMTGTIPPLFTSIPYGRTIYGLIQMAWNAFISMPQWIILNIMIFFCTISMWIFYAEALKLQGMSVKSQIKSLGALGLIGFGISFSNTIAVLRGLLGREPGVFSRTPKYRIEKISDTWRDKKYQVRVNRMVLLEISLGILGIIGIIKAFVTTPPNLGIVPILVLYAIAYLYTAKITVGQAARSFQQQVSE